MLLTSKVVSQLLLPPGGLILLAMIGVIFWKQRWARGCVLMSLLMFWGLSTEPVRDALSKPLEFTYSALNLNDSELGNRVIILLGGGIYANAPEYNGSDELRSYAMMRTLYAAHVAKRTGLNVYATGGAPLLQGDDAEGDVMRRWLIELGVPESKVFVESHANNTWQNATYMKKILAKKGVKNIILLTSAWHMPRSVWCFESQGFNVIAAPTAYLTSQKDYDLRSFVPRWTVFSDSGQALHEYLGLFWYHLKYG
ncbi:MAG: YdcF family protein [Mariprofundaceae bacterium]|nr:YdcF family protein [Mariprofundaceae bacterium]